MGCGGSTPVEDGADAGARQRTAEIDAQLKRDRQQDKCVFFSCVWMDVGYETDGSKIGAASKSCCLGSVFDLWKPKIKRTLRNTYNLLCVKAGESGKESFI